MSKRLRITALLTTYNEERFITACLENLIQQGLSVYLVDESSTDRTVGLAEKHLGRGLMKIEMVRRDGMMRLKQQLEKKEELAATLDSDWFMHVDADEIRLPRRSAQTLADALKEVDRQGYNAVNFQEFTFVPTLESPDHDHAEFQETMRCYYPFLPSFPHRLNAWKRQRGRVDLSTSGGHRVDFPRINMYPQSFPMRHYLYLSVPHAIRKYVERVFDPDETNCGWHGVRATLTADQVALTGQKDLRAFTSDDELDATNPRTQHILFDTSTPAKSGFADAA